MSSQDVSGLTMSDFCNVYDAWFGSFTACIDGRESLIVMQPLAF